jgi:carbonic anhydrase
MQKNNLYLITTIILLGFITIVILSTQQSTILINSKSINTNTNTNINTNTNAPLDILKTSNLEFAKNFGLNNNRGYIEIQKPHTAILCCSDSRSPVELIFKQPKGELFVVREAGNVPFVNSIASLEYAVAVLGVKLLVVLGHTECGAVKAAMSEKDLGSSSLNMLADSIRKDLRYGDTLDEAIKHHANAVLNKL